MQAIVSKLIELIFSQLKPEQIKNFVDAGLDAIENKIDKTENKWDNLTIQPLINAIRGVLDIDDKKYGSDKEE